MCGYSDERFAELAESGVFGDVLDGGAPTAEIGVDALDGGAPTAEIGVDALGGDAGRRRAGAGAGAG